VPYDSRVFRIMVGGPTDGTEYHKAIEREIDLWNKLNAEVSGKTLQVTNWHHHARPGMTPPQVSVNRTVTFRADALLVVFNSKLGTPTEEYLSGTVEEIHIMEKLGRPVVIFFSREPVERSVATTQQYLDMESFRNSMKSKSYFVDFESFSDFEAKIRIHLANLANDLGHGTDPNISLDRPAFSTRLGTEVRRHRLQWISTRNSQPHKIEFAQSLLSQLFERLSDVFSSQDIAAFPVFDEACTEVLGEIQALSHMYSHSDNIQRFWTLGEGILQQLDVLTKAAQSAEGPDSVVLPPRLASLIAKKACLQFSGKGNTDARREYIDVELIISNPTQAPAEVISVTVDRGNGTVVPSTRAITIRSEDSEAVTIRVPRPPYSNQLGDYLPSSEDLAITMTFKDPAGIDSVTFPITIQGPASELVVNVDPTATVLSSSCVAVLTGIWAKNAR